MAVRDDRSDVKQTTTGFRGPLMVQSLTSAKSKFLSLQHDRTSRSSNATHAPVIISSLRGPSHESQNRQLASEIEVKLRVKWLLEITGVM